MVANSNYGGASQRYREAGEWLRGQRRYWQITQAELAQQAGIGDVSLIDGIERGEVVLPRSVHAAIAVAFSVDRAELTESCEIWYGQKITSAA
jgi:transcriptional regulator with XRE-family HTH domain